MADTAPVGEPAVGSTAAPATATAEPALPTLKIRKHKQRSCDEKNEKGKVCAGHLKRWYDYPPEIKALVGPVEELYRCEFCKTLYRPDPQQLPNSFTLRY
jgi:hypothetical protein